MNYRQAVIRAFKKIVSQKAAAKKRKGMGPSITRAVHHSLHAHH
jgi:hypothetical protein